MRHLDATAEFFVALRMTLDKADSDRLFCEGIQRAKPSEVF